MRGTVTHSPCRVTTVIFLAVRERFAGGLVCSGCLSPCLSVRYSCGVRLGTMRPILRRGLFCLDGSEQASATPRPLPVAKRSRFAGGSGAPRPVIRPLVTVTPFRQIPAMCGPITMKTPSRQLRSSGKAHLSGGPPVSGGAIVSSRAVLQRLPSLKGDQLLFLFLDRAAGTLQRHTTAWRQWFDFARASAYLPGRPSVEQVLDFLCALASGAVCARARVGSLRFLAFKP